MVQMISTILVVMLAMSCMLLSDKADAKSLREQVNDQLVQDQYQGQNQVEKLGQESNQMVNNNHGLVWKGKNPACGCNNDKCCTDIGMWRVLSVDYEYKIGRDFPALVHYDSSVIKEFGGGCWFSMKALCAPKSLMTGNIWTNCGGTCDTCKSQGLSCITTVSSFRDIPEENSNDLLTYYDDCPRGESRALCGPPLA